MFSTYSLRQLLRARNAAAAAGDLKTLRLLHEDHHCPVDTFVADDSDTDSESSCSETTSDLDSTELDDEERDTFQPIHFAAYNGHTEILRYLIITCGVCPSTVTKQSEVYPTRTPLHLSASKRHLKCVQYLVEENRVDVNEPSMNYSSWKDEWIPLMRPVAYSAEGDDLLTLQYLIDKGAHVTHADGGFSIVVRAAMSSGTKCLDYLLSTFGRDDQQRVDGGHSFENSNAPVFGVDDAHCVDDEQGGVVKASLLHVVVQNQSYDTLTMLLEKYKANVQFQGDGGYTPLHLASIIDDTVSAKMLLQHGAAIDTVGADGRTPLLVAANFGSRNVVADLLAQGANPYAVDKKSLGLLHHAAIGCSRMDDADEATQFVLSVLHSPSIKPPLDINGCRVLDVASHEAQRDNKKEFQSTPLQCAILENSTAAVKALVDHGANYQRARPHSAPNTHYDIPMDCRAHANATPLQRATAELNHDTVAFLLDNGAETHSNKLLERKQDTHEAFDDDDGMAQEECDTPLYEMSLLLADRDEESDEGDQDAADDVRKSVMRLMFAPIATTFVL